MHSSQMSLLSARSRMLMMLRSYGQKLPLQFVRRHVAMFGVFALLLVLVWPYASYVPVWDGWGYARCALSESIFSFSVEKARCYGHPSMAYMWYLRLFTAVHASTMALYVANVALLFTSGIALRAVARFFVQDASNLETALYAAVFMFSPLLLVHAFHIAPDFALPCFLTLYVSCLFHGRYRLAALAATAMCFTKEVGAGAYVVSVCLLPILFAPHIVRLQGRKEAVAFVMQRLPLVFPVIFLAAYVFFFTAEKDGGVWVEAGNEWSSLSQVFGTFDFTNETFSNYVFNIFALNFQWVFSGVIATAGVVALFCAVAQKPRQSIGKRRVAEVVYLALLLLGVAYVVTRLRPFNNARYVLLCLPPLILLFSVSLRSLLSLSQHRETALACIFTLFVLSNIWTIDPLSRLYYGTFSMGHRTALVMGKKPQGSGRDESAYNMQFLDATESLRIAVVMADPSEEDMFFAAKAVNFQLPYYNPDEKNLSVLKTGKAFDLRIADDPTLPENKKFRRAYFLSFPHFPDDGIRRTLGKMGTLKEMPSPALQRTGVRLFVFTPNK